MVLLRPWLVLGLGLGRRSLGLRKFRLWGFDIDIQTIVQLLSVVLGSSLSQLLWSDFRCVLLNQNFFLNLLSGKSIYTQIIIFLGQDYPVWMLFINNLVLLILQIVRFSFYIKLLLSPYKILLVSFLNSIIEIRNLRVSHWYLRQLWEYLFVLLLYLLLLKMFLVSQSWGDVVLLLLQVIVRNTPRTTSYCLLHLGWMLDGI